MNNKLKTILSSGIISVPFLLSQLFNNFGDMITLGHVTNKLLNTISIKSHSNDIVISLLFTIIVFTILTPIIEFIIKKWVNINVDFIIKITYICRIILLIITSFYSNLSPPYSYIIAFIYALFSRTFYIQKFILIPRISQNNLLVSNAIFNIIQGIIVSTSLSIAFGMHILENKYTYIKTYNLTLYISIITLILSYYYYKKIKYNNTNPQETHNTKITPSNNTSNSQVQMLICVSILKYTHGLFFFFSVLLFQNNQYHNINIPQGGIILATAYIVGISLHIISNNAIKNKVNHKYIIYLYFLTILISMYHIIANNMISLLIFLATLTWSQNTSKNILDTIIQQWIENKNQINIFTKNELITQGSMNCGSLSALIFSKEYPNITFIFCTAILIIGLIFIIHYNKLSNQYN